MANGTADFSRGAHGEQSNNYLVNNSPTFDTMLNCRFDTMFVSVMASVMNFPWFYGPHKKMCTYVGKSVANIM
jgi:hypothetical protein